VSKARGRLDVVATPIGNLADLSARARETLASADLIAAEDTRHTGTLLASLGISRPLISLHEHNESARCADVLSRIEGGARIAVVSDAGTPLLSDPGYALVSQALERGIDVGVVPGVSAITAALAVAGLPTDRFCFEGFLPAQTGERRSRLADLAAEQRTLVLFEAPHRIAACLADLAAAFGAERRAAVAREMTKLHETVYRGTLSELAARAAQEENFARGEITVVVHGAPPAATDTTQLKQIVSVLLQELPPGKAAALAAEITGARRNEAYSAAMELRARGAED
jgi:16S rRNA (cytidine1402-2'-O)-methyltransferase